MIKIKTDQEIALMKKGGRLLAQILYQVADKVKPGISTLALDELAHQLIVAKGCQPSFLGHEDFPNSLCVSINEEIVHGIPRKEKKVKKGDIVSLDLGLKYKGLHTDMALTVPVGKIPKETKHLLKVTETALAKAIAILKPGVRVGDLGHVMQTYIEDQGLSVVRKLVGHGVGHEVHEEPRVPNYGQPDSGIELKSGMTIAIEPMVQMGRPEVMIKDDGWTYQSADGKLTAHFEKSVAITKSGHLVLTE